MSLALFHKLRVEQLVKETADAVRVSFKIPQDLKESFSFTSGQYLTLRTLGSGEELRRCYSIYSLPDDELISVAIKKVVGGRFSTWANEKLVVGDEIEVMPPQGDFVHYCVPSKGNHYLCVASGSGITPILSIVKNILKTEVTSRVTLVFGNKKVSTILFLQVLNSLKNRFMERFQVIHVLSRESRYVPALDGRLNSAKLLSLAPHLFELGTISKTYICGPEAMITDVSGGLKQAGMDGSEIYYELFGTSASTESRVESSGSLSSESDDRRVVTLIVDGRQVTLEVPTKGKSILDTALEANLDLPYACKGGVCGTCRAQLIKGTVRMDNQSVLSTEDIRNGAVLACRAHPVSEEVAIDFDKAL